MLAELRSFTQTLKHEEAFGVNPFTTQCTTCQRSLRVVSPEAIGQILSCPKCGSMVMIEPPAGWKADAAEGTRGNGPVAVSSSANKGRESATKNPASAKPSLVNLESATASAVEMLAPAAVQLPSHQRRRGRLQRNLLDHLAYQRLQRRIKRRCRARRRSARLNRHWPQIRRPSRLPAKSLCCGRIHRNQKMSTRFNRRQPCQPRPSQRRPPTLRQSIRGPNGSGPAPRPLWRWPD